MICLQQLRHLRHVALLQAVLHVAKHLGATSLGDTVTKGCMRKIVQKWSQTSRGKLTWRRLAHLLQPKTNCPKETGVGRETRRLDRTHVQGVIDN